MGAAPRLSLALVLFLAGCEQFHAAGPELTAGRGGSPIVSARNGGAASVTITTCLGSVGVMELVQGLAAHGELAVAERNSAVRLNLNLCGVAANITPDVLAEFVRRRRPAS